MVAIRVPKQLQEELKHAIPHLRIILPAAAAVVWVFNKLVHRGTQDAVTDRQPDEDEVGVPVSVELPRPTTSLGPQLPFTPPRPFRHSLLDATFSVSLTELWAYLMSGAGIGLFDFHTNLGEQDVILSQWHQRSDGSRTRVVRFTTPLNNPLGPRQALNKEVLTPEYLGSDAWVVRTVCTSEGVPFASSFINTVQWVATAEGTHATRLHITGDCKFVAPVWGPLKGTIRRESIRGMSRAYKTLKTSLVDRFGVVEPSHMQTHAVHAGSETSSGLVALMQSHQGMNPAVIVAFVAMFFILWRMALLDAVGMQVMKRLAVAGRVAG
jgi:hypothetical protein